MRQYNVAILGATGAVGGAMLQILEERQLPIDQLYLLASERSAGEMMDFKDGVIQVEDVKHFDFSKVEVALFSAGKSVSETYAPIAVDAGCIVIDNTSAFRYDDDVPLIVPEVNASALSGFRQRMIIANPNCSTIQMVVALKPIYDAVGVRRVNVATYQAVSGAGTRAMDMLDQQSRALLSGRHDAKSSQVYSQQFAFNVIPMIDVLEDNGYTREEMKMVWETQKILQDDQIQVNPTAVRVPVFYGHSEAIHLEANHPITAEQACELWRDAPGVILCEDEVPTAVSHASQHDAVYVGRVREDISHYRGLNFWCVSDNIRKGAALNAVQIFELLIEHNWID